MQFRLASVMLVTAMSWLAAQGPGQPPPRGQRPGQEQVDRDPARPPRPGDDRFDGPPPPPPFGPPPNLLFMAIDTDDDGELSAKEIAAASKSIARLDKNKDGIITEDEVRPPPPPGRRPGPDPKALVDSVMKFDKDGDGKVTARELPERMARLLEEGDANKDGALQRSEIESIARRSPPRRPGPPGGGPPGLPPWAPDNF